MLSQKSSEKASNEVDVDPWPLEFQASQLKSTEKNSCEAVGI